MSLKDGILKLKTTHSYYFQVHGQLEISERNYCYFVVWTPKGIVLINKLFLINNILFILTVLILVYRDGN